MAETIGSLVDKISISELRIWHTQERIADPGTSATLREECRRRLAVICEQRDDLAAELGDLWGDILAGRRRPKLYRQYKMYNDPELRGSAGDRSSGSAGDRGSGSPDDESTRRSKI